MQNSRLRTSLSLLLFTIFFGVTPSANAGISLSGGSIIQVASGSTDGGVTYNGYDNSTSTPQLLNTLTVGPTVDSASSNGADISHTNGGTVTAAPDLSNVTSLSGLLSAAGTVTLTGTTASASDYGYTSYSAYLHLDSASDLSVSLNLNVSATPTDVNAFYESRSEFSFYSTSDLVNPLYQYFLSLTNSDHPTSTKTATTSTLLNLGSGDYYVTTTATTTAFLNTPSDPATILTIAQTSSMDFNLQFVPPTTPAVPEPSTFVAAAIGAVVASMSLRRRPRA